MSMQSSPYRDPNKQDRLPAGTKLTKHLFDDIIAKKVICTEKVQSVLLHLYGKGIISLQEIAIIAGERGLRIVPSTWCKPIRMDTPDTEQCNMAKYAEDRIKTL